MGAKGVFSPAPDVFAAVDAQFQKIPVALGLMVDADVAATAEVSAKTVDLSEFGRWRVDEDFNLIENSDWEKLTPEQLRQRCQLELHNEFIASGVTTEGANTTSPLWRWTWNKLVDARLELALRAAPFQVETDAGATFEADSNEVVRALRGETDKISFSIKSVSEKPQ